MFAFVCFLFGFEFMLVWVCYYFVYDVSCGILLFVLDLIACLWLVYVGVVCLL